MSRVRLRPGRILRRIGLIASLLAAAGGPARAADADTERARCRSIYQELVEIDTTHSTGDTTRAARAMAQRLLDAGFSPADIQVLEPFPRKGNLVLRYRGTGDKRPMLLLAHIDVAEAPREDWTGDPFKLQESGGYFTARGSIDDKSNAAVLVSVLAQLRREGFVPRRDLILALTADEERGEVPSNGVLWLLQNQRSLIDAEFGLNEGGWGVLSQGRPWMLNVQHAEKVYLSYELETSHPGGHPSTPPPSNAIIELAESLTRIARHEFPVHLSELTRRYFERLSAITPGPLAPAMRELARGAPDPTAVARVSAHPGYSAVLRNTCAATMIEGGHLENALPQRAKATINCRVLPHDDVEAFEHTLASLAGDKVQLRRITPLVPSPPSSLRPDLMGAAETIAAEIWPGIAVVPSMSTSASDSVFLRNAGIPMYGVTGLLLEPGGRGAHARDERVLVQRLYDSREFMLRLVRALSN